jgi:hypothetical protein
VSKLSAMVGGIVTAGILGCASHNAPVRISAPAATNTAPALRCKPSAGLPDPRCTPGAIRTTSIQSICNGGSTKRYRPPTSYTNNLKVQQIAEYRYSDVNPKDYEEDHLISLEIGGDGSDPKNLWPEAHAGRYGSFTKDRVENWLHKQICSGAMTPEEAQKGIASDWRQYIPRVLTSKNKPAR